MATARVLFQPLSGLSVAAVVAFVTSYASPSSARGNGIITTGCYGCHRGEDAEVSLSADRTLEPGEEAIFTVFITRSSGAQTGGLFIPQPAEGTLRTLSGGGLSQVSDGLIHFQPKAAVGGAVTFQFGWRAPPTPGGVTLEVYSVAARGGRPHSDHAPAALMEDWVFGCEPQVYYRDSDGDGYGQDADTIVRCAGIVPPGFSAVPGDCDDFRADVHPGATEKCNGRDDNCNGLIDEDAEPVELWPDGDGDGYYAARVGEPLIGCVPTPGYAAEPGDCDDNNPDVHPGATEICNYIDDNCDGRIDERVRPRCGVGWCERESYTCEPRDCVPGDPSPESCNGMDTDCNGLVDDGDLCSAGELCVGGQCLTTPHQDAEDESPESPERPSVEQPEQPERPTGPGESARRGCHWGLAGGHAPLWFLAGGGAVIWRWRRRRAAAIRVASSRCER